MSCPKTLVKTIEQRGLTPLRCITNDMNKSFSDDTVNRAKQKAYKDLFKVGNQKNKAMDHHPN